MKIIPGNLWKNLEISWNFTILEKWEPWQLFAYSAHSFIFQYFTYNFLKLKVVLSFTRSIGIFNKNFSLHACKLKLKCTLKLLFAVQILYEFILHSPWIILDSFPSGSVEIDNDIMIQSQNLSSMIAILDHRCIGYPTNRLWTSKKVTRWRTWLFNDVSCASHLYRKR